MAREGIWEVKANVPVVEGTVRVAAPLVMVDMIGAPEKGFTPLIVCADVKST